MVSFDDFNKLEIRIGTITLADKVPDTDRLLRLIFDFGSFNRQIMSAIAHFYPDPSVLIGKQMPVLVNLTYRNFKGFESQGMIIGIDNEENKIILLTPEEKAPNGALVH